MKMFVKKWKQFAAVNKNNKVALKKLDDEVASEYFGNCTLAMIGSPMNTDSTCIIVRDAVGAFCAVSFSYHVD